MPMPLFEQRMEQMVQELKSRPLAKGAEKIYLPGEIEWEKRQAAEACGILTLTDAMVENMQQLSALTGIGIEWTEK